MTKLKLGPIVDDKPVKLVAPIIARSLRGSLIRLRSEKRV